MRVLPLLSSLPLLPFVPRGLRAVGLEVAALAGRTFLYPLGMTQERYGPAPAAGEGTMVCRTLPSQDRGRPPVLLLHGFVDNRSVFTLLRRSLARHGWRDICALNYSPLTRDVRRAAERLAEHVEEVCERTGHHSIDLVGHSLGGLIGRYYVQRMGGDVRVRTLVTLGTPHSGTLVAPLMSAHPIVRQLRPGSEVIEELARPAPGCRTLFVSFWSDRDQMMIPAETARLDHPDLNVRNIRVRGLGHLALTAHGEVAAGIREQLDPGVCPVSGKPAGETPGEPAGAA